jgi:Cu(I)/Ag(I) efflux system membrane fusion protein
MAEALGAYLAVQDALASDDQAEAIAHGAHFASAFEALAEAPPAGEPHFWHSRSDDVGAVRAAASELAGAADLAAARLAFGHLSVPFARLVEEAGLPEGLALDRYRCGMARDVPDGGIWLQRPGATRNPYFGAAMLTCGARTSSLAVRVAPASHGTHGDH